MIDIKNFWDNEYKRESIEAASIDSNDSLGIKNNYIRHIRNQAFLRLLPPPSRTGMILEIGCGPGDLCRILSNQGYLTTGIDISSTALTLAQAQGNNSLLQYDGLHIPLQRNSCEIALTHSVLVYLDHDIIPQLIQSIYNRLTPEGRFFTLEQVSCNPNYSPPKFIRTIKEYLQLFHDAGWHCRKATILRYNRFPTIYLMRYGILRSWAFSSIAASEKICHQHIDLTRLGGYAECLFELEKQKHQ